MAQPGPAIETGTIEVDFASDVVGCIIHLSEGGPLTGTLSLPFGLTAWMQRYGLGVVDAIDAVLSLRTALLSAAGLDARSEPVPLRVADPVMFVLNLAAYLDELLGRAARALGVSRREAADAAVELLRSN